MIMPLAQIIMADAAGPKRMGRVMGLGCGADDAGPDARAAVGRRDHPGAELALDLLRQSDRRGVRDPARDQAASGKGRCQDRPARHPRARADVDRPGGDHLRPGRGRNIRLVQQRPRLGTGRDRRGPGDSLRVSRTARQAPAVRSAPVPQLAFLRCVNRDVRARRRGVRRDDPDAPVLAGSPGLQRDRDRPADRAAGSRHGDHDAAWRRK